MVPAAALSGAEIRALIAAAPPLVTGYLNLDQQVQPNGIDLTLESVWRCSGPGQIGIENDERVLPARLELTPGDGASFELSAGSYIVQLNEVVELPTDLIALGRPRSSLLRCGVAVHTAVWDAGYRGRSEALLVVYNPAGFRVRRNARILQLVFLRVPRTEAYAGIFQGENVEVIDP